ncbi:MAG TPA: hypothetical protein VFR02_00845, partial [bacterium]|nr:hypothetical protein [bacterium]
MRPARRRIIGFLTLAAALLGPSGARAVQMDPLPFENFSQDGFAFSVYRYEKPSFYLLSSGLPDLFFAGIKELSSPTPGRPNDPLTFSLRGVEYGFQASAWPFEDLQLRLSLPFEATALEDLSGVTQSRQNVGDLEAGATWLLTGKRSGGDFLGLDGWFRFATGTNPFGEAAYPILATGKGTPEGSLGAVLRQQVGRFSLFESVHYVHPLPLALGDNPYLGPGTFQWPDELQALGRIEFLAFERGERLVTLFYEYRFRKVGTMSFQGEPLPYDDGHFADQLFYSGGGLTVRVDSELT